MSLLNLITRGHLDDTTPLSVVTRGHLNLDVAAEVVTVVVEEPARKRHSSGGPKVGYTPPPVTRYELPERKDEKRDIHLDDDDVLEIIIQTIIAGCID